MFYIDPETGEKKALNNDQTALFNDLIGSIADGVVSDVENILEEEPILAHAFDDGGYTALSFAAGHHTLAGLAIVQILMNYGSNVYAEDNRGFTPIHDVNRIADQALKAQFCDAMGIDSDTNAILKSLRHEKALKIARAEVEAEYSAKKAAGEPKADSADASFDAVAAEAERYFNDPQVKKLEKTIGKIDVRMVSDLSIGEEAIQAIESLYSKSAKADQLVLPVNDGLETLLQDMFGSKKTDVDAETKHSVIESLCDWLGIDLSQLAYLVNIASNSGFLPFYHGGHGNPDDDFGNGPFGGNSAVFFSEPDHQVQSYVVTILGNGTLVITDQPQ